MKVSWKNTFENDDYVYAAYYFTPGHWHIYDGAGYSIRSSKDADELIREVAQERHVARRKIKLVKPSSIDFQEVKVKI
jgi:hypothetical protein